MLGSSQPKPGDMSVCIECGFVSVFTRKMRLRVPTKAETREIAGDDRIARYQQALAVLHGWKRQI
jgi:hypothetical protein